jgi:hypothetical protein
VNDQNSFVEQEARTVQEIFDVADGTTTTATTDAELVLLDRATGSKLFLHRIPQLRTADGVTTKITDALICRSCNTFISHYASTRCTHCRATTCVSCAGTLQECKACQKAQWWPRFWTWLCSA